jgi:hypothetical protein
VDAATDTFACVRAEIADKMTTTAATTAISILALNLGVPVIADDFPLLR